MSAPPTHHRDVLFGRAAAIQAEFLFDAVMNLMNAHVLEQERNGQKPTWDQFALFITKFDEEVKLIYGWKVVNVTTKEIVAWSTLSEPEIMEKK